ncbi:MAG: hypothetical protein H6618_06555 [Deltaproteobacteria bacterium]|nr:hypothetical protein [Deltaproteobacteria bacterium]
MTGFVHGGRVLQKETWRSNKESGASALFRGLCQTASLLIFSGCILSSELPDAGGIIESNKQTRPAWSELPQETFIRSADGLRCVYSRKSLIFLHSALLQTERQALDACSRALKKQLSAQSEVLRGIPLLPGRRHKPSHSDEAELKTLLAIRDIYYEAGMPSLPGKPVQYEVMVLVELTSSGIPFQRSERGDQMR